MTERRVKPGVPRGTPFFHVFSQGFPRASYRVRRRKACFMSNEDKSEVRTRIFCVDHRENAPADVLPAGVETIGVGKRRQAGELWDGEGENIAMLNPYLNEITAQWWVWKHPEVRHGADFVGFCHYRRFLRFTPERERRSSRRIMRLIQSILKERYKPLILQPTFSTHEAERLLASGRVEGLLTHAIEFGGGVGKTSFVEIAKAQGLASEKWILRTLELLRATAPSTCVDFIEREILCGGVFYACNMYVMHVEQFETMCERLFPAFCKLAEEWLQEGEPKVSPREPGFIAEVVVGLYWRWLEERQRVRFLHFPIFVFDDMNGKGPGEARFSRVAYRFLPSWLVRLIHHIRKGF